MNLEVNGIVPGFYSIHQLPPSSTSVKSNVGALPEEEKESKTSSVRSNLLESTWYPRRVEVCVHMWHYQCEAVDKPPESRGAQSSAFVL